MTSDPHIRGRVAAKPKVLFSAENIARRVTALASEIAEKAPKDLLVVSILKGSFVFASDLLRAMHAAGLSPEVEFLFLASYGAGIRSKGRVKILRDIEADVHERNVLIIDDILESGRTLLFARTLIAARGARSVSTCVLLDKHLPRENEIEADYHGFVCPHVFVVGYGMDLAHRYRELPFIGAFEDAEGLGADTP